MFGFCFSHFENLQVLDFMAGIGSPRPGLGDTMPLLINRDEGLRRKIGIG